MLRPSLTVRVAAWLIVVVTGYFYFNTDRVYFLAAVCGLGVMGIGCCLVSWRKANARCY
jgi:hypothetical protein